MCFRVAVALSLFQWVAVCSNRTLLSDTGITTALLSSQPIHMHCIAKTDLWLIIRLITATLFCGMGKMITWMSFLHTSW